MSKPAKPFNLQKIQKTISKQSWIVFALVFAGVALDKIYHTEHFVISKNLLAGAILAWLGQLIFAKISLSITGAKYQRQIVHKMYQATMIKWLITFVGFACIFIFLKPLQAVWVFFGYIVVQISYMILIAKNRLQM